MSVVNTKKPRCTRGLALALGLSVLPAACASPTELPASGEANDAHRPGVPPALHGGPQTVTLITGDRVHVMTLPDGKQALQVQPGPGRDHITFVQSQKRNGATIELSVIPSDAVSLLAADTLDARLFNVTQLIRFGFDDASSDVLPLIVTHGGRARARTFSVRGADTTRSLPSIDGSALAERKEDAGAFWESLTDGGPIRRRLSASAGVAKVWLDGRAELFLDRSAPQIGATTVNAEGLTGKGVTVAVLDTGIRLDHPDFQGRIAEARDFTGTSPTGNDDHGHGTHVAGTIAGSGAASGGKYRGVAPEATLISGKVCGIQSCPDSAIIAGMEWAAPKARIVSMSLGGGPTDGTDPLSLAVNRLTAEYGTLFVIAAGNAGESPSGEPQVQQIGAPAAADAALAVASVTKQDTMSSFSSRGPRRGDGAVKPDVAAPGSDIISARAKGTDAGDSDPVDEHYAKLSGTSMATPHVSGAAAILVQAHPEWRAAELKAVLMSSATPIADANIYAQGAGRIDLVRATKQPVFASVPSVSFQSLWPHQQGASTKTVTYRNDGVADVTLDLSFQATDPQGQTVPDGMFTIASSRITVPARGAADVNVTWSPDSGAIGSYSGVLTATGGPVSIRVAVGAYKEPEAYDLTVQAINRDGSPSQTTMALAVNTKTEEALEIVGFRSGTRTIRLFKGQYDLLAINESPSASDPAKPESVAAMVLPAITVDKDTTATLDARAAKPVTITVDRPTAVVTQARIYVQAGEPVLGPLVAHGTAMYATPTAANERINFQVRAVLAEPPGSANDSYRYNVVLGEKGRVPEQLDYRIHDTDLAKIDSRYHAQGVPLTGTRWSFPALDVFDMAWHTPQPVPAQRIEYYTAHDNLSWFHVLFLEPVAPSTQPGDHLEAILERVSSYTPGEYSVDWNRAPLGPALTNEMVVRDGNRMTVGTALFSPADKAHNTGMGDKPLGIAGTMKLERDGVLVGTTELRPGTFEVPPEAATYTLSATATRSVPWSVIGTRADATWTFRSEEVQNPDPTRQGVPLPIFVVRASGAVDELGVAPGGQAYPLTLEVQRQPDAPASRLTELTLDVSYDDGVTWQRTAVERTEQGGTATLQHPSGEGFVSLRMSAKDEAGNTATHTVVRSYQFRGTGTSPDAGTGPHPDPGDGCGCNAAPESGRGHAGTAALLLLTAWVATRRRQRR